MKIKFKFISVVALLVATMIFTGCGNNQTKKQVETIKIGAIVPLSGNAATLGDYTLKGLQLAVEEQNAKGGLLGKMIELDVQDSKGDPKEGVSIIKKMLEGKEKPFMVYSIMSGVTQAIKSETEANKVILMSAVGTDKFLENSQYTVRNYVAANTTGKEICAYLKQNSIKTLVTFYSNNEYGVSIRGAVTKFGAENGIEIITEPFEENSLDYKSLIAARINKKTECVYVAGVGKGLGTMIKQLKESGYTGNVIGDQLITFPDVVNVAGNALNGMPYLDFAFDVNSTEGKTKAFVDAYKMKFKNEPQNFSVITYDGAKLLFDVIKNSQTIQPDSIINKLNEVKNYEGVFGPVSVSNRNIDFKFQFKTWK